MNTHEEQLGLLDVWADPPRAPRRVEPDVVQPGKAGRDHPVTSKQAAVRGAVGFASERGHVLYVVGMSSLDYGTLIGATAADVADRLRKSRNQIATRMLELRELRWIAYLLDGSGVAVKRSTGHGHSGIVHVLAGDARDDFESWARLYEASRREQL